MSDLSGRLDRLRRQTGSRPAPAELAERLRLRGRASGRASHDGSGEQALARDLGGRVPRPGLIEVTEDLPAGLAHGGQALDPDAARTAHRRLAGGAVPDGDLLFLDTETTGLAGGTGTVVFLLGLARLDGTVLRLRQYLLTAFSGEAALLAAARAFADGAGTLVSYNGKSFDLPLLAARYRLACTSNPFEGLAHLDLYHHVRRAFDGRWPDCRLRSAEQRLLDLHRRDDLPGAEAPEAWFRWVRAGRPDRLPAVTRHNRLDVVSLLALLSRLREVQDAPQRYGANVPAIARHILQTRGEDGAFRYLYRRRESLPAEGQLQLAGLARRRGNWPLAVAIWSELARHEQPQALEHLAKYYEHRLRDPRRALEHTRRLLRADAGDPEHRRRERRLMERLNRAAARPG